MRISANAMRPALPSRFSFSNSLTQSTVESKRTRLPAAQTGAILERMDGVLRSQPVLPASPRTGRMDQTAHPHVLLETVALGAHQDQELAGFGREPEVCNPARRQQQQLLADVQNPGHTAGRIQRVAKGARFAQCERLVGARRKVTRQRKERRRRAGRLVEPPTADPHGGWCGGDG